MKYACWQSQLKAAWKNFTRDWELLHFFVFNWKPNKLEVASSFSHLLRCGRGMWDPSSLMRDRIHSHLALEVQSLNHKSWAWEFLDRNACVCACVCVCVCAYSLSHVWFCVTSWTVALQAPLSMDIFRQEHWNGSVQFCSVSQSCPTLCDPTDCSTPGLPVHHQLLEFTQTHVHWVSDAIQPSHPLSPPSPPTFNLSQHQGFFKWVSSSHQVAKILEFQLQHQSFQWVFRMDFL